MVKITPLTDKPLILLISYFLRKVSGKTSEMKRLLQSKLAFPSLHKPYHEINMWCENSWRIEHLQSYPGRVGGTFVAPVSWNTLENASGVTYSETHGPSTTLDIHWKGGKTYDNLKVNVDLTPTIDLPISSLPVQPITDVRPEVQPKIQGILQKTGFHVVPAGFDEWRISFSMAGREILATSHDGFKAGYKWDDAVCKFGIEGLLSPIVKI